MPTESLPAPACRYGYTVDQVRDIMGGRYEEFGRWMRGQTMSVCTGTRYDYEINETVSSGCGPHGTIIYWVDVSGFLEGSPITD